MSSVWSLNFKSLDKLIIFRIRIVEAQQLFDTRIIKYDLFIPLHLSNKDIYKHMSSLKPSEPWNGRKQQHVPWKPASHASLIRPSHFCTCYAHFAFSSASLEKEGKRGRGFVNRQQSHYEFITSRTGWEWRICTLLSASSSSSLSVVEYRVESEWNKEHLFIYKIYPCWTHPSSVSLCLFL